MLDPTYVSSHAAQLEVTNMLTVHSCISDVVAIFEVIIAKDW